jgi:hypothetical protein
MHIVTTHENIVRNEEANKLSRKEPKQENPESANKKRRR